MQSFGRYEVERLVAVGSTGTVYQARDADVDRTVAIKELNPALRELPGMTERLRAEARMLASLDTPHIVAVYDFVEEPARAWLVAEWVQGACLAAVLAAHGRLAPEQALGVLRGALTGLTYAHARGLVHRDISTTNILADLAGTSKLIDFGLAAPIGTAGACGTPAFMSPEIVRGDAVDARSDVYSAGALLYLLLTGAPVFPVGSPQEALAAHVAQPPPDLTGHREHLTDLVRRTLSKDPAGRPADAAAFLAELEQAARDSYGVGWLGRASIAGLIGSTATAAATAAGGGASGLTAAAIPAAATVVVAAGATDTGATDTGATDTGATDTGATATGATATGATGAVPSLAAAGAAAAAAPLPATPADAVSTSEPAASPGSRSVRPPKAVLAVAAAVVATLVVGTTAVLALTGDDEPGPADAVGGQAAQNASSGCAAAPADAPYTLRPSCGPAGTEVAVSGSGCADTGSTPDGRFAFYKNVGGNDSGAQQTEFDVGPDGSFGFTFIVPRSGSTRDGTLDPLPPGDYLVEVACDSSADLRSAFTVTGDGSGTVDPVPGESRSAGYLGTLTTVYAEGRPTEVEERRIGIQCTDVCTFNSFFFWDTEAPLQPLGGGRFSFDLAAEGDICEQKGGPAAGTVELAGETMTFEIVTPTRDVQCSDTSSAYEEGRTLTYTGTLVEGEPPLDG